MLTITRNHSTPKTASRENTPSKNELWEIFAVSTYSTTIFADETHCSCRENHTYAYEPAQGVHYYGYRYYSPLTGRWITRDPTGEEIRRDRRMSGKKGRYRLDGVEPNLYTVILNRAGCAYDALGMSTVVNNGKCPVIAKPEHGGFGNVSYPPIVVMPGESIDTPVDGVFSCYPKAHDCPIMKVPDDGAVRIKKDGRFAPYPNYPLSHRERCIMWFCIYAVDGGCRAYEDKHFGGNTEWGTEDEIKMLCEAAKNKKASDDK